MAFTTLNSTETGPNSRIILNNNFTDAQTQLDAKLATVSYTDATTSVAGKTKLSTAPASPTSPIAVGDNDPRILTLAQVGYVPTADEKAALDGTGTPSATNKFVTNDTLQSQIAPNQLTDSSTPAGEAITAGQAVFIEPVTPQTSALTLLQNLGDVTANSRISTPIFGTGVAGTILDVNVTKIGSPSVALGYRIETDNAGSPSGTAVTNGTGTIAAASFTSYSSVGLSGANPTTFGGTITSTNGLKITTNAFRQIMTSVVKSASGTATRCTLRDSSHNILETATYSGTTATFTGGYVLQPSTTYYIENDNSGSNYSFYTNGSPSYPYAGTNINITTGWNGGVDSSAAVYDIQTITTTRVDITNPSVTLAGSVTLTAGQKYHLLLFQGTYGTETINSTNFYKVGYSTTHTTTRPAKTWNGSAWSSALNTTFVYTSSTLFTSNVLSLTDADYSYKTNLYGLSSTTSAAGTFPSITISGINNNQSGFLSNTDYYLSSTPGSISTTNNGYRVGVGISSTSVQLSKFASLQTAVTSYSASTNYQAGTDGFVVVYGTHSTNQLNFDIKSDTTATPTTIVARYGVSNGSALYGTLTYPVKKGNYWSTTFTTGSATLISFIPLY